MCVGVLNESDMKYGQDNYGVPHEMCEKIITQVNFVCLVTLIFFSKSQ